MTRVLVLTNRYPPHHLGGYELSCQDVMERLAARGHEITVLTGDLRASGTPDPVYERVPKAGTVTVLRDLRLYLDENGFVAPSPVGTWRTERHNHRMLAGALARARPDVVSVWHLAGMSFGLLTELIRRKVPLVYSICDDWLAYGPDADPWTRFFNASRWRRELGRVLGRVGGVPTVLPDVGTSGMFCFVSEYTRSRAERFSRWTYPDAAVVYSGIDRNDFPKRNTQGSREDPLGWRLACAGRLDPRKGFETVLRAMPLLPGTATLSIYGTGDPAYHAQLRALADALGIGERVTITTAPRSALAKHYRDADVVVFPSEWGEPFGLVPLEAMACDVPVVATAIGGTAEFLADGHNCVRFIPGDPHSLAGALQRVAEDPGLRARLVRAGRETADLLDVDLLADAFGTAHDVAAGVRHERLAARPRPLPAGGPDLRVGIVSWNAAELLDRCLACLPAALDGLSAEIVVVDNASSDASPAVAAGHPGVTVLRNEHNEGYARAMNRALAGSCAPVLVALNPDTAPPPGSLRRLVEVLRAHPAAGLVAPQLRNPDGTIQHSVYRFPSLKVAAATCLLPASRQRGRLGRRLWLEGAADHTRSGPVDWAIGAVHVIRAAALADGLAPGTRTELPYRERAFMYAEDLDLCWRLAQRRWGCWLEAGVGVPHVGNAAGELAWGPERDRRWLVATYDWYATAKSPRAARRWALVQVIGVGARLLRRRFSTSAGHRESADGLAAVLPIHLGVLLRGPSALDQALLGSTPAPLSSASRGPSA